ncbi:phage protease [Vibrio sp. TRT 21S02]|uniref:phage protease n=1 Tax=Vibrio sp. TRT 21S02 TaxID=3418507 RepID=UPI003CEC87CA
MTGPVTTALCFSMSKAMQDESESGMWLPMIPAGLFAGVDGRMWNNSHPDAVVASFQKKRPFDVEHSTQLKAPKGEPAPAVGWILKLENRDGEIWGYIEWNEDGDEYVNGKKYAFYSPAFDHLKDGTVTALASSGLTNDPNLNVPSLNRKEANDMTLSKAIREALNLDENATEQDVVTAICSLQSEKETALNSVMKNYVPKETHQMALNRAQSAEDELAGIRSQEIDALVQGAIDDGKVAPANKDMYVSLCRTEGGVDQFKSFLGTAPAIASDAQVKTPKDPSGNQKLEEHEVALCRKMGVTEEEFLTAKEQMNVGAK